MSDSDEETEETLATAEEIYAMLEENEALRDQKFKIEAEAMQVAANVFLEDKHTREEAYSYLLENELFYFNIQDVPNDSTIVLIGRRRTGKSFATRWILYNKRKVFPFGMCQTQTKYNDYWAQYIAPSSIWGDYSASALQALIKRQAALRQKNVNGVDPRVFVVLDDIAADSQLRYDQMLRSFFYYGRHLRAFVVVTSQWFKSLAPGCRENADLIFLFSMTNLDELEAIYKEYAAGVPKNIFYHLVTKYATDSSCFVINPHGKTPYERFFQYRAQDPGKFRMGVKKNWTA